MLPFNKQLKRFTRDLRNNMTDAEQHVWSKIRRKQLKGHQFYRQKNIGNYIVDFYCPAAKLIIEIDGGQHYSEEGIQADRVRDAYLAKLEFTVFRFSDREVFENIDGILEKIYEHLGQILPNPPLGKGGAAEDLRARCRDRKTLLHKGE
jgi:very-short-patch-repair endonuclease